MLIPVSIKTLAEFVHRRGDLYPSLGGRVTGEQGIAAQKRAQRGRPESYQRERAVACSFSIAEIELSISGRLDGCDLDASPPLVEEIKTTRADPQDAERLLGSAHWAQVMLYAALLAKDHAEVPHWRLRLLYCHPLRAEETPFDKVVDAAKLTAFLEETVEQYVRWLDVETAYGTGRDRWLSAREFPYGGFRPHQRALARRVFRAFAEREHLLLEAPTGSGKTMGVIYPALKALAAGHVRRLFYLTSRGTGALAAMKACRDVAEEGKRIRVVELVAKEKACPVAGMPCDETCPYQLGYYDRIHGAVRELLDRGTMDHGAVRDVAQAHSVCPFELSLDAALWADVVVGDYNYLLDPVVRLQRFAEDAQMGLLVDESHQLAERARAMLSLELDRGVILKALRESPPPAVVRRLKALDRAMLALHRAHADDLASAPEAEGVIPPPDSLPGTLERVLDVLADETLDLDAYPDTRALLFTVSRWARSTAWTSLPGSEQAFVHLLRIPPARGSRKAVTLKLACLDPGPYLASLFAGFAGHVRFSGTVSPLSLYQTLHGTPDGPAERLESPFTTEQLSTLVVTDVPVYYRQRQRSLPALADLVADVCAARAGNYLVAVPSFEYLDLLAQALTGRHPRLSLAVQHPGMDDAQRERFLAGFAENGRTHLGLIVLGGVFAESVDFSHAPLSGVICAGVGLPPTSVLRTELERYFEARLGEGGGNTVAFQQPAMTKVLQMAGRLLRSPTDRGILCLVDDRFRQPGFRRFFPGHWQPVAVRAADVRAHLARFWQATTELPGSLLG
ncbi:MAG: ATP-dependent DNA helicase [Pseudomonadales bacterium]